jgi:transposase
LIKEKPVAPFRDVTDEEWQRVVLLLPELRPRRELRGRPLANTRSVLNGVLWVMYSGATWSEIPPRYPSYQTCHRRFKMWYSSGVLKHLLDELCGAASGELWGAMQTRMRLNTTPAHKAARLGVGFGTQVSPFAPTLPPSTDAVSQITTYPSDHKHAA